MLLLGQFAKGLKAFHMIAATSTVSRVNNNMLGLQFAILRHGLLKSNFASLNKLALVIDSLSRYFLFGLKNKT
jgi:hypothetical protein